MTTLSDAQLTHLQAALENRYSGLDLRYEGGPWLGELDSLISLGLLDVRTYG